jgi:Ulp1 family protease
LDFDPLLIPINLGGSHWILVVVHLKSRVIDYYDSLFSMNEEVVRKIVTFFSQEFDAKDEDWVTKCPHIPKQNNANDCGVFVLSFMKAVAGMRTFQFSSDDIPLIRKELAHEIIVQQIMYQ